MTWVNFGILGVGGALLTLPIILHFLMQPKPVEMDFPALRFLKERRHSNRSRMRIRHFLLLLVRCLLIALFAIALAGPSVASGDFSNWLTLGGIAFSGLVVGAILLLSFFRENKSWILVGILAALLLGHVVYGGWTASRLFASETAQVLGDEEAPVAALIVIDTSPRMEYRYENRTRLEVAKEMSQWLVGQFSDNSQVCVVATDGDQPFFSVDVAAANRRIETLETNFSNASIPQTLLGGFQTLLAAPQDRKEVYVITDLTRQSWSGENPKALIRQLKQNEEISLFVIDVGIDEASNFSLSPLQLSDSEIQPGGKLVVSTSVSRQGSPAQRTVKMSIEKPDPIRPIVRDNKSLFPDQTLDSQTVTLDVRDNDQPVPAKFTFSQPLDFGVYHGRIEIEGQDGLAIDDARYFTFRVGQTKKALVVYPTGVNPIVIPSLLAPRDAVSTEFEVDQMRQSEFESLEQLESYNLIFVLDPKPFNDQVWNRFAEFARAGGGVGFFLGYNAADGGGADASFTSLPAQRVLGGRLAQQWFNPDPDLFLSPNELSHPIFAEIRDRQTSVLWNRFPVFTHWGVEPDENKEPMPTQTLLRYGNREPAIVERQIGLGRVLIMTTPITEYSYVQGRPSWNKLLSIVDNPVPAFLLLKGVASYLAQQDAESLNLDIGEAAAFGNDLRQFPERYQVFSPDADKPATNLNAIDGKIRYRFTDAPGHYRLKGVFDKQVLLRGFSANLKPATTDLQRLQPDELDTFLGVERYQLATERNEIQRQQGTTRRGREFYSLAIVMMIVVLAVEYLMSNRFYKS